MKQKHSFILAAALTFAALALPSYQALAKSHTVVCKDGTTSTAGRGACSGHGGVDKTAKPAKAVKKASAEQKAAKKEKAARSEKAAKSETKKAEAAKAAPAESASGGPAGATAKCKDGTYSHAKQHRGACSKHGGVAEWLKQ